METFNPEALSALFKPDPNSHKGQNGKLMVIGGSKLFHSASLWSLKIASRIVDMVFYSSVPENNQIVRNVKEEFRAGIVVPRDKIDDYILEADCVLIGPGLPRPSGQEPGDDDTKVLTERLLTSYKKKKWVIDGGSLQVMNKDFLKGLSGNVVITPHKKEFQMLCGIEASDDAVRQKAQEYGIVVLLKGQYDVVCSPTKCVRIEGGNAGMTKGGTGDVLAGLVAALACKNDLFLASLAASYINKKASDELFKRVGYYYNASDLVDEIPKILKKVVS